MSSHIFSLHYLLYNNKKKIIIFEARGNSENLVLFEEQLNSGSTIQIKVKSFSIKVVL